MIRYLLIKRCRIVGSSERNSDILIANSKIIAIGHGLARPTVETEEIDAKGNFVIPGLVDINFKHSFMMSTDELRRNVHEDVKAGFTTWIGHETPSQMAETLRRIDHQDPRTLNYSLHFSVDEFKHGDLSKIRDMATINGITSLHYTLKSLKAATNDRLDLFLTTAAKYNMLCVFDIIQQPSADEQIRIIHSVCSKIHACESASENIRVRALFTNVRYEEEFKVISQGRNNDSYGHELSVLINFTDEVSGVPGLTPISAESLTEILRQHTWTTADIWNSNDSRFQQIQRMLNFCRKQELTSDEVVEYFTTRRCKFVGLYPNKGTIKVGSDADICITDNLRITTVIQNGLVTFNSEIFHENIYGKHAFRRFI